MICHSQKILVPALLAFSIMRQLSVSMVNAFVMPSKSFISHQKKFALSMSIPTFVDTLTSGLASIARLPGGTTVDQQKAATPSLQLQELYDVENNRACRKVRECITELDLVVDKVIPAAPNGRVFTDSSYAHALPSGTEIPRLVVTEDNGSNKIILTGSDDILEYMAEKCRESTVVDQRDNDLQQQAIFYLRECGNIVANLLRTGRGQKVCDAALGANVPRATKPLVLYSYEGNQFCRLVREVLTELDLVYELRSAGKESPRRQELAQVANGSTQCPFLLDPNQNVAMLESADIIAYLYKTYAKWTPPNELLEWASDNILSAPFVPPVLVEIASWQAGSRNEDQLSYQQDMDKAKAEITALVKATPVVVYTYSLSPFCTEAKTLLDRLNVAYQEKSLGAEWIPGLIQEPQTRAALTEMTGQSSLPHIFVGGQSIGGLFSGTPGLIPALKEGTFLEMVQQAGGNKKQQVSSSSSAVSVEKD